MRNHDAVVIVGASAAGLSAAGGLREGGHDGPIVVLDEESVPGYDRPMLSKGLLAAKQDAEPVQLRTPEQLATQEIEVLAGHTAMGLDTDRRLVVTSWGEAIPWREVIIATGVRARPLVTTNGVPLPTLRSRADLAMARQLAAAGRPVTLVGAGFIGLEVAAALRSRGVDVCLISHVELPLSPFVGQRVARWLHGLHLEHGVDFEPVPTTSVTETPTGYDLCLADGRVRHADIVLAGVGTDPSTEWLIGSGIDLVCGVVTDAAGRTNVPGVWAAGDVASTPDARLGRHRRFEHWTHAIEHGRHVGLNVAQGRATPYDGVPYVWTEQYGHTIHLVGERQPHDEDFLIEGDLSSGDFVVAHAADGELHGATICGRTRAVRTFKKLLRSGASLAEARHSATPA